MKTTNRQFMDIFCAGKYRHPVKKVVAKLALGAALAVVACGSPSETDLGKEERVDSTNQNVNGWNGAAWNGLSWNGAAWNGLGWNGLSWNGLGWNGLSWNGIAWNGLSWNGAAWNGLGWNGSAWDGYNWNGIAGQNSPTFTTLHDWVNHSDADGDGSLRGCLGAGQCLNNNCGATPWYECCSGSVGTNGCIGGTASNWKRWELSAGTWTFNDRCNSTSRMNETTDDMEARVTALAYWVSCACPSTVRIPFNDTHGRGSYSFDGGLGLAPTWCGTAASCSATGCRYETVPESERQLVSACLMSRVNTKGQHFPMSLQGGSVGLTVNEYITHNQGTPGSIFFGNLWSNEATYWDATTPSAGVYNWSTGQYDSHGGYWYNTQKFVCTMQESDVSFHNEAIVGRDCEMDGCDHMSFLGDCRANQKRKGLDSALDSYRRPQRPVPSDTVVGVSQGGMFANSGTTQASYRGLRYQQIMIQEPAVMDFESYIISTPLATDQSWVRWRAGSPIPFQTFPCPNDASGNPTCWRGTNLWPGKLFGLTNTQAVEGVLTGNHTDWVMASDPDEPMSLAIRYSRAAGNGQLRLWVNNSSARQAGWTQVHGSGASYTRALFPATGSWDTYGTAYVYPVYLQDTISSDSPRADGNGAVVTYDTLRFWASGDTTALADSPHLDMAYFFGGPPPSTANCTTARGGCFVYIGPNESWSVPNGTEKHYLTPFLPPGTYTFQFNSMVGGADLYLRVSDPLPPASPLTATTGSWSCRSSTALSNINRSCSVTLGGRGGYIDVMARGVVSGTSSFTFFGRN